MTFQTVMLKEMKTMLHFWFSQMKPSDILIAKLNHFELENMFLATFYPH